MRGFFWGILISTLMALNTMIALADNAPDQSDGVLTEPAAHKASSSYTPPSARLNPELAVKKLNAIRVANGVPPVMLNEALSQAANAQAIYNAAHDDISHYGNGGSTPVTRVAATGYDAVITGEAVAAGQRKFDDVLNGWLNSDSHRPTLLLQSAAHVGLALVYDPKSPSRTYWTMVIAEPF